MEHIQGDAHRFATRGRNSRGKHMLINEASAARIGRTRCGRKRYLPGFPAKRMCKDTARHPKSNNVSWNVVGLDDVVRIVIIDVSPTRKLNVQLTAVLLGADTIPGDKS